jgi:hypothetical protein
MRSSVVFVRLTETIENKKMIEDAHCIGSGTLVTLNSIKGILTAAHVLDALEKSQKHYLAFHEPAPRSRKMSWTYRPEDVILCGSGNTSREGPDLGFVRLLEPDTAKLEAGASVFLNLEKAAGNRGTLAGAYEYAAAGAVDLATQRPPLLSAEKHRKITFLGGPIRCSSPRQISDRFQISLHGIKLSDVSSVGGMSGGGVWACSTENEADEVALFGVMYYEELSRETFHVICHGPSDIFDRFLSKIRVK